MSDGQDAEVTHADLMYEKKSTSERLIEGVAESWWVWRMAIIGWALVFIETVVL